MSKLRRLREGISSKGAKHEIINDTPDNPKDLPLYERLKRMADDLKRGKYNPLKYNGKSVNMHNISSKQREYIFNEINSTVSNEEKLRGLVTRRLYNYDTKVDYLYTVLYDNDGNHKIIRSIKIDEKFYDRP